MGTPKSRNSCDSAYISSGGIFCKPAVFAQINSVRTNQFSVRTNQFYIRLPFLVRLSVQIVLSVSFNTATDLVVGWI